MKPVLLLMIWISTLCSALSSEPVALEVTPVAPANWEKRGDICFGDFELAAFGNLQITLPGDTPAVTLKIRLGEKLDGRGAIDQKPPGSVNYCHVDLVVPAGGGIFKLDIPGKKFHQGAASVKMPASIGEVTPFRYVEIAGCPVPLDKDSVRQLAVHAPFADDAASFESSDETLNAVWKLCRHTMKATTAFGVYIDGERERIPYEGDAYINLLSHYACDLDPRVARQTFIHLLKHPTWPTEWSLHMPMIAHADYEATGNPVLAAENYDAIKRKLLMSKAGPDGLLRVTAIVDWPPAERDGYNDGVIDPHEKRQVGPELNTVANAFYYRALRCTAELAAALKKDTDARDLNRKADEVATAFHATFFDPARGVYIDGKDSAHASLHANMFPLAFGLVPPEAQAGVARFVESRGMACSVYGAQYLLEALYIAGRSDYALGLMTSRSDRSWWHMIEQGSTMTLEAWHPKAKGNLTWNHAWGAAPGNIIARYVLGVRPLSPGYSQILIAPQPGTLEWMRGKVPTPHGPVEISWKKESGQKLEITIPPGTTARVILPGSATAGQTLSIDGKPETAVLENGFSVINKLPPGRHVVLQQAGDVR